MSTSEITVSSKSKLSEDSNSVKKIGDLQNVRASYRLNGKNYLKWSQFIRTYLKGKGRLDHLLGTGLAKEDSVFEAWDEEDSMIMSWLWDSMDPMISDTCMFMATAKEIWEFTRRTYSKAGDVAQVYEIKVKVGATKRGQISHRVWKPAAKFMARTRSLPSFQNEIP